MKINANAHMGGWMTNWVKESLKTLEKSVAVRYRKPRTNSGVDRWLILVILSYDSACRYFAFCALLSGCASMALFGPSFSGPDAESTQKQWGISSTAAESDENNSCERGWLADAVKVYYNLTPGELEEQALANGKAADLMGTFERL